MRGHATRAMIVAAAAAAFLCACGEQNQAPGQSATNPSTKGEAARKKVAVISGRVVDAGGRGVPGVKVSHWYVNRGSSRGFPYEWERFRTDAEGRYRYEYTLDRATTCWVDVGGTASTSARSNRFQATPGGAYSVENLVVRPASKSCKGRILLADGTPAAGLAYGYCSRSLTPIDDQNPPKTNQAGEFTIGHLLPDEPFSFYVFPAANTFWVKKGLDPKTKPLEFKLVKAECIDLPSDWFPYSTHLALASDMVGVKNGTIRFSLPDRQGNQVSLQDEALKDKAVLVNITWSRCGSCIAEIPHLVEFQKRYGAKGLRVVSIAFENGSAEEQLRAVDGIARRFNLNYPLLWGGPTKNARVEAVIEGLTGFAGYPTNIWVGRDGKVRYIESGFYGDASQPHMKWAVKRMEDRITSLLAE